MSPRHVITLLLAAIILGTVADRASARRRSTRRGIKMQQAAMATRARLDTMAADTTTIYLSGYDKPLRSTRETMFAANNTADTIHGVIVHISYHDRAGNMLHSRRVTVNTTIPPGQRRLLSFKSWDRQHTFYYVKSAPSRAPASATPYTIQLADTHIIRSKINPSK